MSERRGVRLDPAVLAALGDGERRARRRGMTPGQRRKMERDEARCTATFDLAPEVLDGLRRAAAVEDCSVSSLAGALLRRGLGELEAGRLRVVRRASRSARFGFVVERVE